MIVGSLALALFLGVILVSHLRLVPQDRLPIQTLLLLTTFLIVLLSVAGSALGQTRMVTSTDLLAQVQLHPITALLAGFMVVGALEAAGAFEAMADALDHASALRLGGYEVLGLPGAVVVLANLPSIVPLPCGRILAAALLPAAVFLGRRVAERTGNARAPAVVVLAFTLNAAASCAPSLLGGIGMVGEGLTHQPIGTFSDPQQLGIMVGTAACAVLFGRSAPLPEGRA